MKSIPRLIQKLFFTLLLIFGSFQIASADVCIPTDPDFDAADCEAQGGTVGIPLGTGGGPGSLICSLIDIVGPTGPVMAGTPVSLSVVGASGTLTYLWSNGSTTPMIMVNPTQSTKYMVAVTQGTTTCMDSIFVQVLQTAPAPVFSLLGGVYSEPQTLTISSGSALGSTIYYTTSGNNPVVGTGFTKMYTGPIAINQTTTIRAITVSPGMANSKVVTAVYTITNPLILDSPLFSPSGGTFSGAQMVSLTTNAIASQIYYTTNGNTPIAGTSFTKIYSAPFMVNSSSQIKALVVKAGFPNSPVAIANFTITNPTLPAAAPVISPPGGVVVGPQLISISTTTPGATIFYTTNGNNPRLDIPNSFTKVYTGPFTITTSRPVRAIATATGFLNSPVTTSIFNIGGRRAVFEADDEIVSEDLSLSIYPNPSNGIFSVQTDEELSDLTLEVWTLSGKKLEIQPRETDSNQVQFDLSTQPSGFYILKVISETSGVKTFRLSKI